MFLSNDTKKALEGRYVSWADGEAREFKLLSNETVEKSFGDRKYSAVEITAEDVETGEEKIFTANRNFLRALSKIDDQIEVGSVVRVVPRSFTYDRDGEEATGFDFDISIPADQASL